MTTIESFASEHGLRTDSVWPTITRLGGNLANVLCYGVTADSWLYSAEDGVLELYIDTQSYTDEKLSPYRTLSSLLIDVGIILQVFDWIQKRPVFIYNQKLPKN